ncbi:hypothetical protein Tco_0086248 [Tanacetum coccineum]
MLTLLRWRFLILYQAFGNLHAMTGRKAHLLKDMPIPSVGVFNKVSFYALFRALEEIHMTWTQFGKKRDKITTLHEVWNPDVNLLKEDVGNIPIWVKLHGDSMIVFSEDGLSAITTKLGTPFMLDSYTSYMCMQSWGTLSYARAMIELRADVELKDTIVVAMPKLDECPKSIGSDVEKKLKNASQAPRSVMVGSKVEFKPIKQVYGPLSKKNNVDTNGNKKKDVESRKEVSNSNPFDVLNSVENDVDLGTNEVTSNLASKEANSSGSLFWNMGASSTSTTPIVDKIDKFEKLIIDGKVTLVDDEGKPLKKVDYPGDHDSEDEVAPVDNEMASFLASERVSFGTNSLLE